MTKQTNTWVKTPKSLMSAKDITPGEKLVYAHMLSQYTFFRNQGKPYKESQESIAEACGMSKRSVVNAVAQLQEKDMLCIVERLKVRGGMVNNVYTVQDTYGINQRTSKEHIAEPF